MQWSDGGDGEVDAIILNILQMKTEAQQAARLPLELDLSPHNGGSDVRATHLMSQSSRMAHPSGGLHPGSSQPPGALAQPEPWGAWE